MTATPRTRVAAATDLLAEALLAEAFAGTLHQVVLDSLRYIGPVDCDTPARLRLTPHNLRAALLNLAAFGLAEHNGSTWDRVIA